MQEILPPNVIEAPELRDELFVFHDRRHAGTAVANLFAGQTLPRPLVLGIPSGGVPVAAEIARATGGDLDIIIARKLQLPWNPEAGFGACTVDGPVYLSQAIVAATGLSKREIEEVEGRTRDELRRRDRLFRGGRELPAAGGRNVVIADDGLASGVTMMAAVAWARSQEPARLVVAVPTGHLEALTEIARMVDLVVCPNIRAGYSFAVAQAYKNWHDLGDQDVIAALAEYQSDPHGHVGSPGHNGARV